MKRRSAVSYLMASAVGGMGLTSSGTVAAALPAQHTMSSLNADGLLREWVLHLPPTYTSSRPLPLVIMLHGMGGTAAHAVRETGWSVKADIENFMVVYPQGSRPDPKQPLSLRHNPAAWNDGSGRFHSTDQRVDDVGFLRAVIDRLSADYAVDPRRIYVTGFSNGASMAFRAGAQLSDRLAAIAPVAGACWTDPLRLLRGVSLCYLTGSADTLNPLAGGFPKLAFGGREQGGRAKPPVKTTIEKWARALQCADNAVQDVSVRGLRTLRYGPGMDGAEVLFTTVEGLGHAWPGGENLLPQAVVGKQSDLLNATDAIWEFFRRHPIR